MSTIPSWVWIPIVVWAAFAQTLRNAAQRSLVDELGALGATLVRFLYGLPVALVWLLLVLALLSAADLPPMQPRYLLWLALGAAAQIGATACLLVAMKQRNFIVGVTFSKTEVLQVGILATVLLQELPGWLSSIGMLVATAGVVLLSLPQQLDGRTLRGSVGTAAIGLASGALFALSAVGCRTHTYPLPDAAPLVRRAWGIRVVCH